MLDGVANGLEDVTPARSSVAIGVFDGVHLGHRALIARAAARAGDGDRVVVVTFDPHPVAVVAPHAVPPLLQPMEDRVARLREAGADLVLVLPFTHELSRMTPEDFVSHVLAGPLRATSVVVGDGFRFGHRAAGDVPLLQSLGTHHGFGAEGIELLALDGAPVSSTEIRSRLARGDVAWVTRALGRPWEFVGEVVGGDQRGRTIGFPTANVLAAPGLAQPAHGVYAGRARRGDEHWDCVVNVGTRPTFDGVGTTFEAHLLDAEVDLYGDTLHVALEHRVRDEVRFSGPDELVAQIARDVDTARELLTAVREQEPGAGVGSSHGDGGS